MTVDAGGLVAPMSVSSGPERPPAAPTRWQLRHRPSPSKIARPRAALPSCDRRHIRVGAESRANERDERAHLVGAEPELGHARSRDAGGDQRRQRVIRRGARQAPAAEIDAAHANAGCAMALRAIGLIDLRAGGDVSGGIVPGVVLGRGRRAEREQQQDRGCQCSSHVAGGYTLARGDCDNPGSG